MSRAQVSVEFALIFVLMLVVFVVVASFAPDILRDSDDPKQDAQALLETIKLHTIIASTSTQNYEALVAIPPRLGSEIVTITVLEDGDNIASINSSRGLLSKIDLPVITLSDDDPSLTGFVRIQNKGSGVEVYT